ncbi:MAG: SCO family protein [Verrucomicrobium sp.]|nr:SCO family protein [Verrucomicrobium sp.]
MRRWEWVLTGLPILLLGAVLTVFVLRHLGGMHKEEEPLPRYAQIHPFSFVDQDGRPFTEKDLLGKVWVAQFFFTSCPGPCPAVSHQISQLQDMLSGVPEFRLVSIAIDPENDTPAALREYAARMGAQPGRWIFLTGTPEGLAQLVRQDFMIGFQKNPDPSQGRYLHSTKVALVDPQGVVRGYYEGLDMEAPQRILSDIGRLLREQPAP